MVHARRPSNYDAVEEWLVDYRDHDPKGSPIERDQFRALFNPGIERSAKADEWESQNLLRLGNYKRGRTKPGTRYKYNYNSHRFSKLTEDDKRFIDFYYPKKPKESKKVDSGVKESRPSQDKKDASGG